MTILIKDNTKNQVINLTNILLVSVLYLAINDNCWVLIYQSTKYSAVPCRRIRKYFSSLEKASVYMDCHLTSSGSKSYASNKELYNFLNKLQKEPVHVVCL